MNIEDLIPLAKAEGQSQADDKHRIIEALPSNAAKDIIDKNNEKRYLNALYTSAFLQGAIFGHGVAMRDKSLLKSFLEYNAQREEEIRKNGLIYEGDLPEDLRFDDYVSWFMESKVIDGVRMGPAIPCNSFGTVSNATPTGKTTSLPAYPGDVKCGTCDNIRNEDDLQSGICDRCQEKSTSGPETSVAKGKLEPICGCKECAVIMYKSEFDKYGGLCLICRCRFMEQTSTPVDANP